jgi:phosphotransferase system enzyme I (PtsI)
MKLRKGIAASPGYAIGEAFLLDVEEFRIPRKFIAPHEVEEEIRRTREAFTRAQEEYEEKIAALSKRLGKAVTQILRSHQAMLSDGNIQEEIFQQIRDSRTSPEYSVSTVIRKKLKLIESWGEAGFGQRIEQDLIELERVVLRNLLGKKREGLLELTHPIVLVAHDLSPGQTATLDRTKILGIVTDKGGKTSHTSLVAASLGIPAVVGLGNITKDVTGGDQIVVDGATGTVLINPDTTTVQRYQAKQTSVLQIDRQIADKYRHAPARTKDGVGITVLANVDLPSDLALAVEYGADGIGLYRTEFLYLTHQYSPSEADQLEAYQQAVSSMGGRPLTIRTLDLGADKMPVDGIPAQTNPFLGVRAIRLCLERVDLLQTQLRAILRATANGKVSIMVPMVSTREEIIQVREILEEVKRQLMERGESPPVHVPLGIMVEVPSAALGCELLAPHVDFFSIGTNDLVAYLMAVDRTNEKVAQLYQPSHPIVLRVIKGVIDCGSRHSKPVSICGEMSGDPLYVPLLLGMGLRVYSVVPHIIPEVKRVLEAFSVAEAVELWENTLSMAESRDIDAYLQEELRRRIPEVV